MPAFKEICRRLWIELTAHRAHPPPPPALHYVPVARLAIPRAAFTPLRTPERPEWAAGWDFRPSPFRRDFTPYMELERLPWQRSATPEPQGVAAIMQQSVSPLIRAITPVRLLRALTPEPALLDILRQPRTPADNSPSASEGSPSSPTDRTRDPDWRLAGPARRQQVVDQGTPVARRTRRRLQGNLLRNNQFAPVVEEEEEEW
jgi:hypothetical protein